jgi:hypothetical protein
MAYTFCQYANNVKRYCTLFFLLVWLWTPILLSSYGFTLFKVKILFRNAWQFYNDDTVLFKTVALKKN